MSEECRANACVAVTSIDLHARVLMDRVNLCLGPAHKA